MTMTKAERAAMDDLRNQLAMVSAFRRTGPVERDLPPPKGEGLSKGWDYNSYSARVYMACSSNMHHGDGWKATSSQRPAHLFSTAKKALAALRHEVEIEAMKKLAEIDATIAIAKATQP